DKYLRILRVELVPALGCTEPISIAYAAAKAREVLGVEPDRIIAECSRNVIKNVMGVIVPTTHNMRGIETSAILGAVAGRSDLVLEVLHDVTEKDIERTKELLLKKICKVEMLTGGENLRIIMKLYSGDNEVIVEILDNHSNIVRIEKNGETLFEANIEDINNSDFSHYEDKDMSINEIYEFATTVDLELIKPIILPQIKNNCRIAKEGLTNQYGANVGKVLIDSFGTDVKILAKAYAAAGSDARMSGSVLPVTICSGSGNQGMTTSLPVIKYAEYLKVSKEKLYRALALSNLIAIRQKIMIGKLSAYCGAVSAACGSGAAITYLHDAPLNVIEKTITNTIANVSGILCDGAKPSCAAKIASAVDAAIMGHLMAMKNMSFESGEGLVKDSIDKTIETFGAIGREGMRFTDIKILDLMIHDD
ncbi:MAG: serine dehydratase subunit alpha family protein, partial [Spirochaetales bacterium]|nr:serine dehydratase subunit alpha family protein [Spirochaetales bacterium]